MSRDEHETRPAGEALDEARRKALEASEEEAPQERAIDEGTDGEILLPWERPAPPEEPAEEAPPAPADEGPPPFEAGDATVPVEPEVHPWEPPPPEPVHAQPPSPEPAVPEPLASEPAQTQPAEPPPEEPSADTARTADLLSQVAAAARRRAQEARQPAGEEEDRQDYRALVRSVDRYVDEGYDLLGLVGYSASGKTHFLKALSLLLKAQGFEVAEWEKMRRVRVPTLTGASIFDYACTGPGDEKWVFVDAGGELYARLRSNDWELANASAGLLHSLHHCRGLFLLLHLQPGHLHRGALGSHRWMSREERERDLEAQKAQEELEFFDHFLLFLRALKAEGGDVTKLVLRCAETGDVDKALRPYREGAPRLDIPVAVLFTQADTLADSPWEVAEGEFLSPRRGTMGVAPFVARHLPDLFGSLLRHARRFKFDFVQSYEEKGLADALDEEGRPQALPRWEHGGEPLSVGALAALELILRNLPARRRGGRWVQRYELETRQALRLDRWLHPKRWRGVEVLP